MNENAMNHDKQLFVEKEPFEYNGKTYFHYYIKGVVRGHDVKISLAPPNRDTDLGGYSVLDDVKISLAPPNRDTDLGGYSVLDIVFDGIDKAEFVIEPYEIRDDKTKKVVTGNRYLVRTVDEDGKVYECAVRPERTSDRSLLNMLLAE